MWNSRERHVLASYIIPNAKLQSLSRKTHLLWIMKLGASDCFGNTFTKIQGVRIRILPSSMFKSRTQATSITHHCPLSTSSSSPTPHSPPCTPGSTPHNPPQYPFRAIPPPRTQPSSSSPHPMLRPPAHPHAHPPHRPPTHTASTRPLHTA